ncbi:unnamed protein product [Linum trigynum]|uniref:Uncharacterized protein n=1 Tax=Linum trigynum TaxID=586398 RepID=A0AAV2DBS5_9ROSI
MNCLLAQIASLGTDAENEWQDDEVPMVAIKAAQLIGVEVELADEVCAVVEDKEEDLAVESFGHKQPLLTFVVGLPLSQSSNTTLTTVEKSHDDGNTVEDNSWSAKVEAPIP